MATKNDPNKRVVSNKIYSYDGKNVEPAMIIDKKNDRKSFMGAKIIGTDDLARASDGSFIEWKSVSVK